MKQWSLSKIKLWCHITQLCQIALNLRNSNTACLPSKVHKWMANWLFSIVFFFFLLHPLFFKLGRDIQLPYLPSCIACPYPFFTIIPGLLLGHLGWFARSGFCSLPTLGLGPLFIYIFQTWSLYVIGLIYLECNHSV